MRRVFRLALIGFAFILLSGQMVSAGSTYSWYNNNYNSYYRQFNLAEYELSLPEVEIRSFSLEARRELFDIATLYGNRDSRLPSLELDRDIDLSEFRSITSVSDERNSFNLTLSPDMLLNASFNQNDEELETTRETNLSLEYWVNNKTLIRAEYDRASREWWETKKDLTLNDDTEDSGTPELSDFADNNELPDEIEGENEDRNNEENKPDQKEDSSDLELIEPIYKEEKTETGRVGISYKTSDNITLSADYVDDNFTSIEDFSTVLGVEYHVDRGALWYEYQVDHGSESKQRATGLEYGLNELATLSASYKLLDNDLITDRLQESIWDFGLDLSLSDFSSLSIGYQLKRNEDLHLDLGDEDEKESNIEAQLEINF